MHRGLLDDVGDSARWLLFWKPEHHARIWSLKRRFDHARARADFSERDWRKMMRVFNEWPAVAHVTCNWNWSFIDSAAKTTRCATVNRKPTKAERRAHELEMRRLFPDTVGRAEWEP